ncbi:N-acetylmuramoyl-L-alanine amidase [Phenylobacterium sp.]|uniref:N-acetylmuramoyl-L-alanine amidase n=1 Tax=Phenylobacterium sp. TaxID=1871053 RepID=UPI000C89C725|nr:N-acetylmuramoyl-L-alanine amidase [Phenylobacterium sp.]MAK81392.1 N-acetylmuramoyl-L-alanine amidase [Phenylobacterium sp.]
MRKINKIIVHCSATREGRDYSVDTIRKWHLKRGWRDIGYHFVIQLDGEVNEGRPIEQTGAHVKGHNFDSIGICYIGGVEEERNADGSWEPKDTRTPEQKEALEDLLLYLKDQYPSAKIYGHNNFSSKACPSFDAKTEYEYISNMC